MAINIPILTEFDSKGLQSAQGAFNNFKTQVGQAEGAMGKFKAGGTAALDAVKANAGAFAATAGTAIASFALKAIGDFQDLALEVDKFSNSTGLAVEEASRWIEVAGDVGVESGTLLNAVNKLNKAVGDNSSAFAELGAEIVRTSSGATDVNATFLNTIEALRKIDDPAKRAALATQTLGKSWTEISELVEMGATGLKAALEDVSDAKIIDEGEIAKAKELRAAQDALNDAIEDFTLQVGQKLIPAFTGIVKYITPVIDAVFKFNKEINLLDVTAIGIFGSLNDTIQSTAGEIEVLADGTGILFDGMTLLTDEARDNREVTEDMADAWKGGYRAMIDARRAADGLNDALVSVDDALAELKGNIDDRQAFRNLIDTVEEAGEAAIEAFAEKTPEAMRRAEDALDDARLKVAQYIADIEGIPQERKTAYITALDQASYEQVRAMLDALAQMRQVPFMPSLPPGQGGISEIGSGGRPIGSSPIRTPVPFLPNPTRPSLRSVVVNVGGSVISENDLVETVRKGLVNAQRNGSGLVYTNK